MDERAWSDELLLFFKALAEPNRLKIVGLLAREPLSVEQMAEMLGLASSTVSHHLTKLAQAGLVSARAEGYYNIYRLEIQVLEGMARRLLAQESLPAAASDVDLEAYDRKVLKNYVLPDGSLKQLPSQVKKMEAILRYVVREFQPGVRYTEKQVNEILGRFNEDTARIRRALVDGGYMQRQGGGGEYWRVEE